MLAIALGILASFAAGLFACALVIADAYAWAKSVEDETDRETYGDWPFVPSVDRGGADFDAAPSVPTPFHGAEVRDA